MAFGPCVAGLAFDLAVVLCRYRRSTSAVRAGGRRRAARRWVRCQRPGLVLGLAALVPPIAGARNCSTPLSPCALGGVLLVWFLAADKQLSRVDAGFLLAAFVVVSVVLVRVAKSEPEDVKAEFGSWVPAQMSCGSRRCSHWRDWPRPSAGRSSRPSKSYSKRRVRSERVRR